MRLIGAVQGAAGFRESHEEYVPERGVDHRDLIELVKGTYDFQAFPNLPPGTPPPPVLNFIGGRLPTKDGPHIAIGSLLMGQEGDVVIATNTDLADVVLEDLMRLLDENLGFRLRESRKTKSYVSNVVVEFDRGLEEYFGALSRIIDVINAARRGKPLFNIKQIGFGARAVPLSAGEPIATIEEAEFLIERRAGHAFEENRYFCSAPLTTAEHVRVLEQIEAIARDEAN